MLALAVLVLEACMAGPSAVEVQRFVPALEHIVVEFAAAEPAAVSEPQVLLDKAELVRLVA